MADDEVGLDPARLDRRQDGEARRHESRLLHLRLDDLVLRRLETEVAQVEARRIAAALEHIHRLGHRHRDLAAHPGVERALAREAEGDQAALHSVHSIKPDPHVRPAPMPVIRTRSPFFSRPSRWASASASGIEPDDVLP